MVLNFQFVLCEFLRWVKLFYDLREKFKRGSINLATGVSQFSNCLSKGFRLVFYGIVSGINNFQDRFTFSVEAGLHDRFF